MFHIVVVFLQTQCFVMKKQRTTGCDSTELPLAFRHRFGFVRFDVDQLSFACQCNWIGAR